MSSHSPVGIEHCGRTIAADVVAFTIRWAGHLSDENGALWSVLIRSVDGEEVRLGYERVGGGFSRQFVQDLGSGAVVDLAEDAELREHEVTVRFPASYVGVAVDWPTWTAHVSADGATGSGPIQV